jgi:enoyl-CoA hydratase/carnithine racemase
VAADVVTRPYERLVVERRGLVGWIVNDRPDALNAYDDTMRAEFRRAYRQHEDDPAVRVIVHAAHGRAFQVGVDVASLSDGEGASHFEREVREFDLGLTGWHLGVTKPVVVAINGVCAGGGLHWLADGDVVLAASDATFVDPHVSIGQVTAFEVIGLARRAPFEAIMRMALVGRHERLSAGRAHELGLVSEVVDPPADLHDRAQQVAERIAEGDVREVTARRAALWRAQETWRRPAGVG